MPRIAYEDWKPRGEAQAMVSIARDIAAQYAADGYDLTLRQLYYQFVARDHLRNNQRNYKRLGDVINRARLAGLLDWNYIVDRTRALSSPGHWDSPEEIISTAAGGYAIDKWEGQPTRVEVWVEKEALAGVVDRAATDRDVPHFSCRGYVSQSELWRAGRRLGRYIQGGQNVVILHLGDHDPSGLDMTRDIRERLEKFIYSDWLAYATRQGMSVDSRYSAIEAAIQRDLGGITVLPIEVRRIALNMDQVEEYQPPPNPTKFTDSRAEQYLAEFGEESWELDALDPATLNDLITTEINGILDAELYADRERQEQDDRDTLALISDNYHEVAEFASTL